MLCNASENPGLSSFLPCLPSSCWQKLPNGGERAADAPAGLMLFKHSIGSGVVFFLLSLSLFFYHGGSFPFRDPTTYFSLHQSLNMPKGNDILTVGLEQSRFIPCVGGPPVLSVFPLSQHLSETGSVGTEGAGAATSFLTPHG